MVVYVLGSAPLTSKIKFVRFEVLTAADSSLLGCHTVTEKVVDSVPKTIVSSSLGSSRPYFLECLTLKMKALQLFETL